LISGRSYEVVAIEEELWHAEVQLIRGEEKWLIVV
jgi:hypothetical protein